MKGGIIQHSIEYLSVCTFSREKHAFPSLAWHLIISWDSRLVSENGHLSARIKNQFLFKLVSQDGSTFVQEPVF